ncbi:hypothetical protein A4A49_04470 [Nicotiana attenuata]|uniref:Uncharacterized protein n=1 Tax=Nicotiana attenuata TaxID=49451 RepID=A0A314LIV6_NICAT|nr:hypothetical protein A4A49_04470 [Nicotiana attenuata]
MQQYVDNEELECAAAIGSKTADPAEVAAQIGNVEDGLAYGNRGSAGVEQSLLVPYDNAVPGKQSAIVLSNLEATVPLNVTSERAIVMGSTDGSGIIGVRDSKEIDRVASVVDGKGQTMVQQAAPDKSKVGTVSLEVGARSVTPDTFEVSVQITTDCATEGANIKGATGFHDKGDDYEGLQISRSNCEAIALKNVAKESKVDGVTKITAGGDWIEMRRKLESIHQQ